MKSSVPQSRVRLANDGDLRSDGDFVLYWMIAARRVNRNFALDRAVELARELEKPLLVLEGLRAGYRWASTRLHRFVLDGMRDNRDAFEGTGVLYHPYVERREGDGKGLLEELAGSACAVVTDEFPCFFLPRMVAAAAGRVGVRMEVVDSNGILPIAASPKAFARAFDFRRYLQRELAPYLSELPRRTPLSTSLPPLKSLPKGVAQRWPRADDAWLDGGALDELPIDASVGPVETRGGTLEGRKLLKRFLRENVGRYAEDRNQPEDEAASLLSPYLHFGHLSSHEVLMGIASLEGWSPDDVSDSTSGKRTGWWGMSEGAEAYLDQLVTWRELGYNFGQHRDDIDRFESLPDWALETLGEHERDPRPYLYDLEEFEAARTHDEVWNAAQNQLVRTGRMHNYLRMLWGKKILHWSRTPREALATMIELNNKYALDGRNPNSYSGIFWVLGRYDRAWGPEREVFGKIRYMSVANTKRKLKLNAYLERWAPDPSESAGSLPFG